MIETIVALVVLAIGAVGCGFMIHEIKNAPLKDPFVSGFDRMDGLPVFKCCNHCFFENGQLAHSRTMLDKHTVACNERPCSQNLREF